MDCCAVDEGQLILTSEVAKAMNLCATALAISIRVREKPLNVGDNLVKQEASNVGLEGGERVRRAELERGSIDATVSEVETNVEVVQVAKLDVHLVKLDEGPSVEVLESVELGCGCISGGERLAQGAYTEGREQSSPWRRNTSALVKQRPSSSLRCKSSFSERLRASLAASSSARLEILASSSAT